MLSRPFKRPVKHFCRILGRLVAGACKAAPQLVVLAGVVVGEGVAAGSEHQVAPQHRSGLRDGVVERHGADDDLVLEGIAAGADVRSLAVDDLELPANDGRPRVAVEKCCLQREAIRASQIVRIEHRHQGRSCLAQAAVALRDERSGLQFLEQSNARVVSEERRRAHL